MTSRNSKVALATAVSVLTASTGYFLYRKLRKPSSPEASAPPPHESSEETHTELIDEEEIIRLCMMTGDALRHSDVELIPAVRDLLKRITDLNPEDLSITTRYVAAEWIDALYVTISLNSSESDLKQEKRDMAVAWKLTDYVHSPEYDDSPEALKESIHLIRMDIATRLEDPEKMLEALTVLYNLKENATVQQRVVGLISAPFIGRWDMFLDIVELVRPLVPDFRSFGHARDIPDFGLLIDMAKIEVSNARTRVPQKSLKWTTYSVKQFALKFRGIDATSERKATLETHYRNNNNAWTLMTAPERSTLVRTGAIVQCMDFPYNSVSIFGILQSKSDNAPVKVYMKGSSLLDFSTEKAPNSELRDHLSEGQRVLQKLNYSLEIDGEIPADVGFNTPNNCTVWSGSCVMSQECVDDNGKVVKNDYVRSMVRFDVHVLLEENVQ